MKLLPYPAYKDSNVGWLGEVPKHWSSTALKRVVETPITDGPHETPEFLDEGVPFVSAEAVASGSINFDKIRGYISKEDHEKYSLKYHPRLHDIFMIKSGATTGVTAIVETDKDFNIWSPLAVIRCGSELNPRFVLNFMRSRNFQEAIALNWSFGTQQNIGMGVIENLSVTIPPLSEQSAIATFLDRETTKLDILIAKQECLIELLKEKYQAIVSHAVTKGLNPDATMKDSGVEWLGVVPAHWEALTLRRISKGVYTGGTPSEVFASEEIENGFVWYTPGDFNNCLCLGESSRKTTQDSIDSGDAKLFPNGSVLIVSIGATLGKVGFAKMASSANQQINAVIPNSRIDGYFLAYSLSVKSDAMKFLSNASTIGIMNQERTKELCLAVPPLPEQITITTYLDQETAKIDTLIEKSKRSIELAKEHRTALISAAVTGKIDVREAA